MSAITDTAIKKLVRIAEAVALGECEAVEHGREPCPLQYDDQEHWCLSCQAKQALSEHLNAYSPVSRTLTPDVSIVASPAGMRSWCIWCGRSGERQDLPPHETHLVQTASGIDPSPSQ